VISGLVICQIARYMNELIQERNLVSASIAVRGLANCQIAKYTNKDRWERNTYFKNTSIVESLVTN